MIPFPFYIRMADQLNIRLPGPVESISFTEPGGQDFNLLVKRDDLLHPVISGNKWRKLLGHLYLADRFDDEGILTFGGAYSNHLHATAYICKELGLSMVALVKGFPDYSDNPCLSDLRKWGVEIKFLSPALFEAQKDDISFWKKTYPAYRVVPEGGKGPVGRWGFRFFFGESGLDSVDEPVLILASGTGTTAAGMRACLPDGYSLEVWPVISGEDTEKEIRDVSGASMGKVDLRRKPAIAFAGWDSGLIKWMLEWKRQTGFCLDPLYTGPVFYRALQRGTDRQKILYHSGGLQGWRAYLQRYRNKFNSSTLEQIRSGIPFDIE